MLVGLVCARKNSKGLKNKNLRHLGGIPLIGHSIEMAKSIDKISDIIVSTDCEKIAETARFYGASVPFLRPAELAQDNSAEWLVWQHAIKNFVIDLKSLTGLVVLPPTGPLREKVDICKAIDLYYKHNCDVVLTTSQSHKSPAFNMVCENEEGFIELGLPLKQKFIRRQDAPQFYDISTNCYVVKPNFVLEKSNLFDGKVKQLVVDAKTAVDIDTIDDLEWAQFLYDKKASK